MENKRTNQEETFYNNTEKSLLDVSVSLLCKKFAEWIGTEYKQDEGSVIGNIYYERGDFNKKDYTIDELWVIFCDEHNTNNL